MAIGARHVEGVEPQVYGTAADLEASRPLPLGQCRLQLTDEAQMHGVDRRQLHGQLRLFFWVDAGVLGQRQRPPAPLEPASQLQIRGQGDQKVGAAGEKLGSDLVEVQGAADPGVGREVEDEPFSNQAKGAGVIAGGQEMPCRRAHLTGVSQVLGGPLVQAPLTRRVVHVQLGLQDFLDQLVVAIRDRLVVDAGHEQVAAVELLEEDGRSRAAQGVAGRHRQLVENRGGQHELDQLGGLAVENLVEEIPGHGVAV